MYASVEAVAEQWRPLDNRESAVAAHLLDRVSALMRRYASNLDARILADPDLGVVAGGIAVDAVLRVMRSTRPDATGTEAEKVDFASLYLTQTEIRSIAGTEEGLGSGAFTIRPFGHGPRRRCLPWQ
jgi:hypothetical protein